MLESEQLKKFFLSLKNQDCREGSNFWNLLDYVHNTSLWRLPQIIVLPLNVHCYILRDVIHTMTFLRI